MSILALHTFSVVCSVSVDICSLCRHEDILGAPENQNFCEFSKKIREDKTL